MTRMRTANDRLRIIVLGYIVRDPLGGMALKDLQVTLGLAQLGHDVFFVEDSDDYPSCYDPVRNVVDVDPTYGLRFAAEEFSAFGLADRWAYYDAHRDQWHGPCADRILSICNDADLVINLCGVNPLRAWWREVPVRALIDQDPAFTQVRHLTDKGARTYAAEHTSFFTFGENIGTDASAIPDDGFPWQATRQPVVLDAISAKPPANNGAFTTVMQWNSYAARTYNGVHYGMKSDSFLEFLDVPASTGPIFDLAVGSPNVPRNLLQEQGWRVQDPRPVTRNVATYLNFIESSKAEFSVAKHGYVVSNSGWFSERTAAYLAHGRPALVQDSGFTEWLAGDAGVVAFRKADEAIAGVEEINARYTHHCQTARSIVEEYFNAHVVLESLLERAMVCRPQSDERS